MDSFIIVFTHRLNIGLTAIPYHAVFHSDSSIELLEHVTSAHIKDRPDDYTEEEKQLVRLLHTISDKELFKKYSRESNIRDFKNNIPSDILEKRIRPEIEKKMYRLVRMLAGSNIAAYYRPIGYNNLYQTDRLRIPETPCQPVFRVDLEEDRMTYSLRFRQDETTFSFAQKNPEVICSNPAVLKWEQTLYYFDKFDSGKLNPFKDKDCVLLKGEKVIDTYMAKFIVNIVESYDVQGTGLDIIDVDDSPEIKLVLEKDLSLRPVLRFKFRYGNRLISPNRKTDVFVDFSKNNGKYLFQRFPRDYEAEKRVFSLLRDNGLRLIDEVSFVHPDDLSHADDGGQFSPGPANLVEWVRDHKQLLDDNNIEPKLQYNGEEYSTMPVATHFETTTGSIDWFDIKCIVEIPPYKVPFIRFRRNILNGNRRYMLPDGSIFIIPRVWFTRFFDLFNFGKIEGESILLPKNYYHLLDELQNEDDNDSEGIATPELPKLKDFSTVALPPGLNATLRPYQIEGYQWLLFLRRNKFGGILADDMGLGKTLQTIALLLKIYSPNGEPEPEKDDGQLSLFPSQLDGFNKSGLAPSLIVMPTSLVHNWNYEIKRFAPMLKTYIFTGANRIRSKELWKILRHYHVVITTYGILRNDVDILRHTNWEYLILDESQNVKNPLSKGYHAVSRINARHHLALTGTPIENSLTDLWAQMNIVNEGLLKSLNFFKRYYEIPISKNEDEAKSAHLQKMINPFLMRRTKELVAKDLPPLMEQMVFCDMSPEQKDVYERTKSGIRNEILESMQTRSHSEQAIIALQGLTRLRQAANHPAMLYPGYRGSSGKFDQMMESLENIISENHNVLVFSSFVKDLELLEAILNQRKINYAKLIGATTNRQKVIEEFNNDDKIKIFLISLKAGGVGLNLTKADYVFMLNPWWNPKAEAQAISRAHRIGQARNVFVYRFISVETIEEKIARLQEKKNKLADAFVNTTNPLSLMNPDEIRELFS